MNPYDKNLVDRVGRMMMIGFSGEEMTGDLERLLLDVRPGGIILFRRNVEGGPEKVARLNSACQSLARSEFGRPLLIAIDQEGGPVMRLGEPFLQAPSQREAARTRTPAKVKRLARAVALQLFAVGINFNLTPVLDIVTDPEASFMMERSFGPDPVLTARYGTAVIEGHAENGVMTCAKHFPGIGDVYVDPHLDLPEVHHSAQRIRNVEVLPFAWAIERGVPAIMTSHIMYPALDAERPVTFSPAVTRDLLREELGFRGLVLTDDLEMGAIVKHYRIGPAAVMSVKAGGDLVLVCKTKEYVLEARDALLEAVRAGEIPPDRLEESAARLDRALAAIRVPTVQAAKEVFKNAG